MYLLTSFSHHHHTISEAGKTVVMGDDDLGNSIPNPSERSQTIRMRFQSLDTKLTRLSF